MTHRNEIVRCRRMQRLRAGLLIFGFLFCFGAAKAQVMIAEVGKHYAVDFLDFTGAGFQSPPLPGQLSSNTWSVLGWSDGDLLFGGSKSTGDLARGMIFAPVTTGGVYAYVNGAEKLLYWQPVTNDFEPGNLILLVQNETSTTLHAISIAFLLYCRNDQPRSNLIAFSYSQDNIVYTDLPAMSFASPLDPDVFGLVPVDRFVTLPGLVIPPSGPVFFRWTCTANGGAGARDEFGLSNISITGYGRTAVADWTRYR